MKALGTVVTIAHNGRLLVKGRFAPEEGAHAYDFCGRALGRVVRVFGPVTAPFVAIVPSHKPSLALIGAETFVRSHREASADSASV